MASSKNSSREGAPFKFTSSLPFFIAIFIALAITGLLNSRDALSQKHGVREPLTVATTLYKIQSSYQRQVRYLGLIVAVERANLSFEVSGLLASSPLREGTPVESGETIATLDTEAISLRRDSIQADLKQVKVDLELAQLREKRQRKLLSARSISEDIYDETRLAVESLEARAQSVRSRLASIELDIEKSRLVAPYSGIIADRFAHKGTVVSAGTPIVRLISNAAKEAHVGVSAERAQALIIGQSYQLALQEQVFLAELLSVRPDVDPLTRSTTAVFAIPENMPALDGVPINLLLSEVVNLRGGWLPLTALQEGKRGIWTVMRVEELEDNNELQAVREAVQVLEIKGEFAYVQGTLKNNSRVIASGLHRLAPGSKIQAQES